MPKHSIRQEARTEMYAVRDRLQDVISTLCHSTQPSQEDLDAVQIAMEALRKEVHAVMLRRDVNFGEVASSRMSALARGMSDNTLLKLAKAVEDGLQYPNCADLFKEQIAPLMSALETRLAQIRFAAFEDESRSLAGYNRKDLLTLKEAILHLRKEKLMSAIPLVHYERCLAIVNIELVKQPVVPVSGMSSAQLWEYIDLINSVDSSTLENTTAVRARWAALRNTAKVEIAAREMRPVFEKCVNELANEAARPGSVSYQFGCMKEVADRLLRRLGSTHSDETKQFEVIKTALHLLPADPQFLNVLQRISSDDLRKLQVAKPFVAGRDHKLLDKLLSGEMKARSQRLTESFQKATSKLITPPSSKKPDRRS